MDKKALKISVGTAAYNEESNIKHMLESICNQHEKNIQIIEIIVVSDGSSDQTVKIAKSIQDKRIKVIDDGKRFGQARRIAQILELFKGDYLILMDSDMVTRNRNTFENLIKGFKSGKNIGLVAGKIVPLPGETLIEKAVNNYRYGRFVFEKQFSFGKSAYGTNAFFAMTKQLAKSIKIPKNGMCHDSFCYFSCIIKGFGHSYVENAIVFYRSPQTAKDLISQSTRHLSGGLQLKSIFGAEIIDKGFFVPKSILIKVFLYQLLKNPLGYIVLKTLNIYSKHKSKKLEESINVKWAEVSSSKNLFVHEIRNSKVRYN